MLTQDQFDILYYIKKHQPASLTQREIAGELQLSLGKVNAVVKSLKQDGLIDEGGSLTLEGLKALAPYKVKNAVIMAAGMSTRFAPLSYEKPKALLSVKGELLIEREIRQLQEAGIPEIIIVVGYMKEKLFYLADKFSNSNSKVSIVVNEDYYRYNNTSTLILVADKLDNTYICSSDNYFTENPFESYVYHAYYSAVYTPEETDEYCLTTNRWGRITAVTHGGRAAWYMLGHVYFDRDFSRRFVQILKAEYDRPDTKAELWEDLYIKHIKELNLQIKKYDSSVIKEFDSLDELREFDKDYLNHTDSKIFKNICRVLHCEEKDITNIHPIKTGLTNLSFFFTCKGKDYVYRHPGVGTDTYINRESEAASMEIAKDLGLDDTFIYISPTEGWKISHFVHDAVTLDYHNDTHVKQAMSMIRKLHTSGRTTAYQFDVWKEIDNFEKILKQTNRNDFEDAPLLAEMAGKLHKYTDADKVPECICHCDSYDPNYLIDKNGKMYLIDWEYSGMSDPGVDVGTFLACSDYSLSEAEDVIRIYYLADKNGKVDKDVMRHYLAYAAIESYYWFVWALYQDSVGKTVGKWLYLWYQHTKMYGRAAIKMYED